MLDSLIIDAVRSSKSIKEVLRKLGMANSRNYSTIRKVINKHNLDTSHFKKPGGLKPISNEDVFKNGSTFNTYRLKERIIKQNLIPYVCAKCGLGGVWCDEQLSLQIDHINGIRNDNRLENLRFLCPNCHSQTETYGGNALRNGSKYHSKYRVCKCGNKMARGSVRCKECEDKNRLENTPTKIEWPPIEKLLEELKDSTYTSIADRLGVSIQAVWQHIQKRKTR